MTSTRDYKQFAPGSTFDIFALGTTGRTSCATDRTRVYIGQFAPVSTSDIFALGTTGRTCRTRATPETHSNLH